MMTLYEFFKEEAEIMGKYVNGELVEVVRCKDCIAFDSSYKICKRYGGMAFQLVETDYCSYGERKEE